MNNRMNCSRKYEEYDEFIPFFKTSWCKIASAAMSWTNSVPQTAGTTFAFSSVLSFVYAAPTKAVAELVSSLPLDKQKSLNGAEIERGEEKEGEKEREKERGWGGGRERERHLAGGSLVRISHISPPANTHTRHARTRVPQHTHDNYIFRENIAAS